MNKSELINSLSEETSFNKRDISLVLDRFVNIVQRELKKGSKVSLSNFGTFSLSHRPERRGINPSTKERISLPAVNVPKFKAGKNLRESVRSTKIG